MSAIDGTHIKIVAPRDSAVDYFSRNQQHDFIIQAVADGKGLFLDFAAGYPGSIHDARYIETARFIYEQAMEIYSRNPLKESASQIFSLTW